MATAPAAQVAQRARAHVEHFVALDPDAAATSACDARDAAAGSTRRVTLLPEPDSPRMPSVSPRFEVEADAVHRVHGAVGRDEGHVQVADLQKRGSCRTRLPCECARYGPSRVRMWQATSWPRRCRRAGGSPRRRHPRRSGQRVRKRQPDGGSIGLGGSPWMRRLLGAPARVHRRPRRQQRARVGMLRIAVDRLDRARSRRSCRDTSPARGR